MLSYLHEYHAGNHADILKHFVLTRILEHLKEKEKPFTIFDTHAGAGLYNLSDERAKKTQEAENGIIKLLEFVKTNPAPESLKKYISLCQKFISYNNENVFLPLYPGSPMIENEFLEKGCSHILCELHPREFSVLKSNMKNTNAKIYNKNGYESLLALTPPVIKRGLALIDPSYEEKSDYIEAEKTIISVHKKWPVGIIALWYPLLAKRKIEIENMKQNILNAVKSDKIKSEVLDIMLLVNTEDSHKETSLEENSGSPRLYGSGMFIINSPWKLDSESEEALPFILDAVQVKNCGSFFVKKS